MTGYAEVIGDPISQSKSPQIHGFWIDKLELDADYRMIRVGKDELEDYLEQRRTDPDWSGSNVTMPHKQAVLPFLDQLEPLAERIGAVNTIVRSPDGRLLGRNTDVAGFLEPLRAKLDRQHYFRMARVIGTGGAARAVVAALTGYGFTIVLAGRDREKARALLNDIDSNGRHHDVLLEHFAQSTAFAFDDRDGCCDLVVNASPLGMRGQPSLQFDWSHAPPGSIAYDVVTDPVETEFLRNADRAGFEGIDGLSMLIGQAATAFSYFFGADPPREYDDELRELLTS